MVFKTARLDTIATIISIVVTLFLSCLSIFFIIKVPFGWAFAIFIMLIVVISYLLSPKQYLSQGSKLIIEKVIGKKIIIPFEEIEGYVLIPNFMKLKAARTFGNGGLFGYYGIFSTAEYGNINCQLTSLKNIFIIKTQKENFAISPVDVGKFEEFLKATAGGITGEIPIIEPFPKEKMKYASSLILIVPIVLFVLIVIFVLLNYAQLPEQIAVHFDIHGNPDRWGSKSSYLTSSLIPATILFIISIGVFFFVRRTTNNPAIPNFLVLILSFMQFFAGYVAFETYWVNKHNTHFIPIIYGLIVFAVVIVLLLFVYYRKIVKKRT